MSSLTPAVHSVQFYDTHEALIDRLCAVVCSGFLIGNAALIVATADHRKQLVKALDALKVDVRAYMREQQFTMCDAEETLARFMVNGLPDPQLFLSSVGQLVADAKQASRSQDQGLVVFGEMVSVLWDQGNREGALALERLWNDLLNERAFHLHCAYHRSLFAEDRSGLVSVCDFHSHILGSLAPAA